MTPDVEQTVLSPRKREIRDHFDRIAPKRAAWRAKNAAFYADDRAYMRFTVAEGCSVIDLGCGDGELLAALKPSRGVGIDLSPRMVEEARRRWRGLDFRVGDVDDPVPMHGLGGRFDFIVMSDTIGYLEDCEIALSSLHALCHADTRIVISYYSHLWEPVLRLAEFFGRKMPQPEVNFLSSRDIANLLYLADLEAVKYEWRQILPLRLFGLGPWINRIIGPLPLVRRLGLRNYIVARSLRRLPPDRSPSVSIVIPCRNERGNIEPAIQRLPKFADDMEVFFVEGHSSDGTLLECERVRDAYAGQLDVKISVQDGVGKGDAMRKGLALARGEVLMILDADLSVPPEMLPKFYHALVSGKGELVIGTRLVYPRERHAMRLLNFWANRLFAHVFSIILNQRFTDTLCGTKVLSRRHYQQIAAQRSYFGNFDPFGDFDLLFGAAKLNLKIVEVPVRYAARRYGEPQISRFRDGWLLLRMVAFAWSRLKAF